LSTKRRINEMSKLVSAHVLFNPYQELVLLLYLHELDRVPHVFIEFTTHYTSVCCCNFYVVTNVEEIRSCDFIYMVKLYTL